MVTFTACRKEPEVVVPARATPQEVKSLSDMDNHAGVRIYITAMDFFRSRGQAPEEIARTFKDALAGALVYYYPMAGRLRELPGGKKLVVDCTAEGAVFVEAQADVRLEELGEPLVKPHPCIEELKCDVGNIFHVVGKPLLYLQMTQLRCGGLVLALSVCHILVDVSGMYQIFKCITDLARGQALPAVLPTWERQLLVANHEDTSSEEAASLPPPPSLVHDQVLVTRFFLFGPREIAALRSAATGTVFELITAVVWRCRATALQFQPHQKVRLFFTVNARGAWKQDPPLPPGFYGNAAFISAVEAGVAELCDAPLERAVRLVREAKLRFTDEHVRSYLDMMARGNHIVSLQVLLRWSSFFVSDVTRVVDHSLDIGSWAERVGGSLALFGDMPMGFPSSFTNCKDANGDRCVLVPMCLPELAMGRFASQIATIFAGSIVI